MSQVDTTFSELGLKPEILKAIKEMGFEAPTRIQAAAIPAVLRGRDLAGQAQTGTGKTAAYAIPILEKNKSGEKGVQALVLCPTRELAVQVTGEFIKLSRYMDGIQVTPVYGGQPIQRQIRQLERGTSIVVGTPGRVIDHLNRGTLNIGGLSTVILDEADEMLSMGFRDDLETILNYTSGKSQAVMFSATLSKEIKAMMKRWFSDPEMIEVAGTATTAEGIEHRVVEVRDSMRTEAICRFLDKGEYRLALIFCNTKRKCDSLAEEMQSRGYSSDVLHGDMNQDQRDRVMRKFRSGRVEVLIATDVAARGLDVEDVDVVFNYDIPQDPEYYVHRVGRTGRAGRKGEAYTFWAGRKRRNITAIEKALKMKLDVATMPTLQDVEDSRADTYLERVVSTLEAGGLRPWIERVERAVAGKFTHVEVAAALLKMQSDSTSQNFKDTNGEKRERPDNDDSRSSRGARQGGGGGRGHKSGRSTNSRAEKRGGKKKKEAFYKHFEEKKSNKRSRKGR